MILRMCKLEVSFQGDASVVVYIWAASRENVSSEFCDQVRFKLACSAAEASYSLETLRIANIHIVLSKLRTTKVLIRLRGCAGWYTPLLFAYGIRHVFVWPGLFIIIVCPLSVCLWCFYSFEPSHEIMALFAFRKLILQTRMRSHPVGLDVWFLVRPFVYFHTSCVRTAKALAKSGRLVVWKMVTS